MSWSRVGYVNVSCTSTTESVPAKDIFGGSVEGKMAYLVGYGGYACCSRAQSVELPLAGMIPGVPEAVV